MRVIEKNSTESFFMYVHIEIQPVQREDNVSHNESSNEVNVNTSLITDMKETNVVLSIDDQNDYMNENGDLLKVNVIYT